MVNLRPAGRYMMEDFFYAGGLPALMREMGDLLHQDVLTVSGSNVGQNLSDAKIINSEVIASRAQPLGDAQGLVVLRGNLCPNGAILKQAAATPELLQHEGVAVVFGDFEDMHARIDDPDLDIDENSVMVMKKWRSQGRSWNA